MLERWGHYRHGLSAASSALAGAARARASVGSCIPVYSRPTHRGVRKPDVFAVRFRYTRALCRDGQSRRAQQVASHPYAVRRADRPAHALQRDPGRPRRIRTGREQLRRARRPRAQRHRAVQAQRVDAGRAALAARGARAGGEHDRGGGARRAVWRQHRRRRSRDRFDAQPRRRHRRSIRIATRRGGRGERRDGAAARRAIRARGRRGGRWSHRSAGPAVRPRDQRHGREPARRVAAAARWAAVSRSLLLRHDVRRGAHSVRDLGARARRRTGPRRSRHAGRAGGGSVASVARRAAGDARGDRATPRRDARESSMIACYVSGKGMYAGAATWNFKVAVIELLESEGLGYDTRYRYYRAQFPELSLHALARKVCDPIEYYDRDWPAWRAAHVGEGDEDSLVTRFFLERDTRFRAEAEAAIFCFDEAGFGSGVNIMRFLERRKAVLGFYHRELGSRRVNTGNILQLAQEHGDLVSLRPYAQLEEIPAEVRRWVRGLLPAGERAL